MNLNEDDEIVEIRLPKAEVKILREIIKERETYNHFINKLKTNWIWFLVGGLVATFTLWEKFHALFSTGAIK